MSFGLLLVIIGLLWIAFENSNRGGKNDNK